MPLWTHLGEKPWELIPPFPPVIHYNSPNKCVFMSELFRPWEHRAESDPICPFGSGLLHSTAAVLWSKTPHEQRAGCFCPPLCHRLYGVPRAAPLRHSWGAGEWRQSVSRKMEVGVCVWFPLLKSTPEGSSPNKHQDMLHPLSNSRRGIGTGQRNDTEWPKQQHRKGRTKLKD